ncbi:metallophosphoesterase [Candidatus Bipolaricaulota bacterium]
MKRPVLWIAIEVWVCVSVGVTATAVSQVHLGWSTNDVYTTMTVLWHADVEADYRVTYGLSSQVDAASYPNKIVGRPAKIHPTRAPDGAPITTIAFDGTYYRAELTGLRQGTTYYFRVEDPSSGESTREWSFRTIQLGQMVKFTFAGDSQRPYETHDGEFGQLVDRPAAPANWPTMRDFITQAMAYVEPDFVLGLGDFVAQGNNQAQWSHWFDAWQEHAVTRYGRMIPIVPVIGNHDIGEHPDVDASYEWFLGLFAVPQIATSKPWYSLDFPNLHLTVLSATSQQAGSNRTKARVEAESQQEWLAADLESSADAMWKIVAFHYNYLGCFASCTGYPSDDYMTSWTPALEQHGANVVLMGHVHNYTRSWPIDLRLDGACGITGFEADLQKSSEDGITYVVSGTWGAPNDAIVEGTNCALREWIAAVGGHPSYGLVRVEEDTVAVTALDTAWAIIDHFTLPYVTASFPTPEYVRMVP